MTVIWKKDETYGKQKANWFSQRLESQEQNKITKYPSEYLDRKHKMSTIKGKDGRNNTGLRIIHRIIHTFYLGHILCVGKNGKDASELLKGGEGSRTQVIYILKSSKAQDSTKKSCGVLHTHTKGRTLPVTIWLNRCKTVIEIIATVLEMSTVRTWHNQQKLRWEWHDPAVYKGTKKTGMQEETEQQKWSRPPCSFKTTYRGTGASMVTQTVKNLPAMQKTH